MVPSQRAGTGACSEYQYVPLYGLEASFASGCKNQKLGRVDLRLHDELGPNQPSWQKSGKQWALQL